MMPYNNDKLFKLIDNVILRANTDKRTSYLKIIEARLILTIGTLTQRLDMVVEAIKKIERGEPKQSVKEGAFRDE